MELDCLVNYFLKKSLVSLFPNPFFLANCLNAIAVGPSNYPIRRRFFTSPWRTALVMTINIRNGKYLMRLFNVLFLTFICAGVQLRAQDTNVVTIYTKLEAFEAQTEKMIVKAWGQMGTVTTPAATFTVTCREATEPASGARESGVSIGLRLADQKEYRMIIDYDELDAVLAALEYIAKVDLSVTTLPSFSAVYRTRSDLRFVAYNSTQRAGTVHALQIGYNSENNRIPLAPEHLNEFRVLMRAAKEKLDALKKG